MSVMIGVAAGDNCCATTASGHAAAALPVSAMNSRRLIRSPQRPLGEESLEFPPGGLFTQTASPCGTFSQFQSGPKPQLAEFGNRAANRRIITATAAHRTSAMRSRRLVGAYGQIIFSYYHSVDYEGRVVRHSKNWVANVRFGSKADTEAPPSNVRFTPKRGTFIGAIGMSALCHKRTW
jgi:hypothetical protein